MTVRCSYPTCECIFEDVKQMRQHKYRSPSHHYCKKCDYDALDWDDMLEHKIRSMTPFLIGHEEASIHNKMKHLCCEFCGEDFKSFEGRLLHRRQMHQAPQNITCQGRGVYWNAATNVMEEGHCGLLFIRASDFIEHLEQGHCQYITAEQFHAERQYRHVLKQILADPEMFSSNMLSSKAVNDMDRMTQASDWSARPSQMLLDDDDAMSEVSGYQALLPKTAKLNLMDQSIDHRSGPSQHGLGRHGLLLPSDSRSSASVMSLQTATSVSGWSHATMQQSPNISTRALTSLDSLESASQTDSISSTSTIRADREQTLPALDIPTLGYATSTNLTNWIKTLPDILKKPINYSNLSLCDGHEPDAETIAANKATKTPRHFLSRRWYDPTQPTYDPELFYHALLEKYKCPFARCQAVFVDLHEIQMHMQVNHVVPHDKCSVCNKKFSTVTGLIRHFEASIRGSRCFVADWAGFKRMLSDVTGGFLNVEKTSVESSSTTGGMGMASANSIEESSTVGGVQQRNVLDGYATDAWGQVVKVEKRNGVSNRSFEGRGLGGAVVQPASDGPKALMDRPEVEEQDETHVAEAVAAQEMQLRIEAAKSRNVDW